MKNRISKKRHNSYSGQRRKKNFRDWPKNPHFYGALAMLLPLTAILIAYIAMGVFPFGNQATMIIDSYHQYVPFFSEFHDKIWHGESFLYSWHGSLGFNFIAVQAYYLASPLNFLIALFPASMMIEAFETLIVLKICLSGWTAYRYLRRRTGRNDYSTVVFASFYALGGFSIAYNWNVMWLDSIVLFPIILMGVEKLINAVAHPNFGALVDIGNFSCADEYNPASVGIMAPYAIHAHAKDFHIKSGKALREEVICKFSAKGRCEPSNITLSKPASMHRSKSS